MSVLDQIVAFVKVVASELVRGEPTFNVTAVGGFTFADGRPIAVDNSDEAGEPATEQVAYGPLGVIGRPLPPDADAFAEAVALRIDGGLAPIAWRDVRLFDALGGAAPAAGQIMLAGYGGAFLSLAMTPEPVGSRKANISTWYVPYAFDADGAPAKAHTIAIDPTPGNSSITLVHGDGVVFSLSEDVGAGPGIAWAVDGATFGRMSAGEVTIQAARIMLRGNVYLGRQAEAGAPLLGGPISPPSPSVFVSPT